MFILRVELSIPLEAYHWINAKQIYLLLYSIAFRTHLFSPHDVCLKRDNGMQGVTVSVTFCRLRGEWVLLAVNKVKYPYHTFCSKVWTEFLS